MKIIHDYEYAGIEYQTFFLIGFKEFMVDKHGFFDYEDQAYIFTQKGRNMQKAGGFIKYINHKNKKRNERERRKQLEIDLINATKSNEQTQRVLSRLTYWIAAATVTSSIFSILETLRNYYNPVLPVFIYWILPFSLVFFFLLISYNVVTKIMKKTKKMQGK